MRTLWISRNKSRVYQKNSGWASDTKPEFTKSANFQALYVMQTQKFCKCELAMLEMLGVKEGECKQFSFEDVTDLTPLPANT